MSQKHGEGAAKAIGIWSNMYRNETFRMRKASLLHDTECQRCQLFRDAMGFFVKRSLNHCPCLSQPSQEVVKEMIQFSKDTLEKIDKARSEGLYHEVRIHFHRDEMGKRAERFSGKRGKWGRVEMGRLSSRLFFLGYPLVWTPLALKPLAPLR